MHQTKKGNQWYFGMKVHIGVDAESGLTHSVATWVAAHHYLRFHGIIGKGLRHVAVHGEAWLALVDWQPGAFKVGARDRWIGWSAEQQFRRLHLVANNSRFVILTPERVPNLASRVLGLSVRRLSQDLRAAHGYPAVLALRRYRAANFHRTRSRPQQLALAAIVARVLAPDSKLATARRLSPETATSSLGALLELGRVTGNELLDMLDWLLKRQPWIERALARRHLKDATLILYDVSSSYLEGQCCPLAAFGHNRDGKKGKKQIVFGLLCSSEGCPIAIELFTGNTADPRTLASQVEKIRTRFGIARIALVGDRGMITTARIHTDLKPVGLAWISALKTTDLRKLAKAQAGAAPALTPDSLVPDAVAEITSPDFPGERLLVCLNPRLRQERRRKREDLLQATELALERIGASVRPGTLSGKAEIGRRVGREANRRKVEKHFEITIGENHISWKRRLQKIEDEARFDGIHVIRTCLSAEAIGAEAVVVAYKSLSAVERAFRIAKSDLRVRPVYVYTQDHVRGHLFLCMLAYYLEWHMRQRLAPLLFEEDHQDARSRRTSPVEKAEPSPSAKNKAATKHTPGGLPVHSFRTLLDDLSSVVVNTVRLPGSDQARLAVVTRPTKLQTRAFQLLEVHPEHTVPMNVTT